MPRPLARTFFALALTAAIATSACAGASTPSQTTAPETSASSTEGSTELEVGRARGTWEHQCELRRQTECGGCRAIEPAPAQTSSTEEDTSFRDDVEIGPERPVSQSMQCSSAASGTEVACASFCCTGCPRE